MPTIKSSVSKFYKNDATGQIRLVLEINLFWSIKLSIKIITAYEN